MAAGAARAVSAVRAAGAAGSVGENSLDVVDQLAQVKRLGENLAHRHFAARVHRHRGKSGDEQNLQFRARTDGAAGEFDAVDARHHDVGDQQLEFVLVKGGQRGVAIGDGVHVMARTLKRARKKSAHGVVVFSQQYARRGHALDAIITVNQYCSGRNLAKP